MCSKLLLTIALPVLLSNCGTEVPTDKCIFRGEDCHGQGRTEETIEEQGKGHTDTGHEKTVDSGSTCSARRDARPPEVTGPYGQTRVPGYYGASCSGAEGSKTIETSEFICQGDTGIAYYWITVQCVPEVTPTPTPLPGEDTPEVIIIILKDGKRGRVHKKDWLNDKLKHVLVELLDIPDDLKKIKVIHKSYRRVYREECREE